MPSLSFAWSSASVFTCHGTRYLKWSQYVGKLIGNQRHAVQMAPLILCWKSLSTPVPACQRSWLHSLFWRKRILCLRQVVPSEVGQQVGAAHCSPWVDQKPAGIHINQCVPIMCGGRFCIHKIYQVPQKRLTSFMCIAYFHMSEVLYLVVQQKDRVWNSRA